MKTFSFTGAKKIVFGNGSFAGLAGHLAEMKVGRPLVVLDGNLAGAGFGGKVAALMEKAKIGYVLFDKAAPEPPIELADEGAKLALKKKCDGVVGIGGGSAMDLAKAIAASNFLRYRARTMSFAAFSVGTIRNAGAGSLNSGWYTPALSTLRISLRTIPGRIIVTATPLAPSS